mgnify:CR=1 FL=1
MKAKELSVLLLEDNSSWLGIGKRAIEEEGIKIYNTAKNESQALNHLKAKKYDLLICDTMQGDSYPMGPNVAREAKKAQTPVVVALSSSPLNKKLWEGLADYFFIKDEFYSNRDLKKVLKEKFGIKK